MMKRIYLLQRLGIALLALFMWTNGVQAGALGDVKDSVKKSFKVRPGGTLYLDMDQGNIAIESTPGDMVLIEVERTVSVDDRDRAKRVLDNHSLSFDQRGNDIAVKSRFDEEKQFWNKWGDRNRMRIQVRVEVPERYNIDFTSGAGNVSIADIDGNVNGRTGAGNIEIGAVLGPVSVTSGSGNVDVKGAIGRVEVMTGAGNVMLNDVRGELDVHTGAGNVDAAITRQPEGDSRLESGAGNVTVYLSDQIGVYVDAVASVGSASCDYPLKIEGSWMKKSFEGPVNGGGPDLRMRTGVGNVKLRKQ